MHGEWCPRAEDHDRHHDQVHSAALARGKRGPRPRRYAINRPPMDVEIGQPIDLGAPFASFFFSFSSSPLSCLDSPSLPLHFSLLYSLFPLSHLTSHQDKQVVPSEYSSPAGSLAFRHLAPPVSCHHTVFSRDSPSVVHASRDLQAQLYTWIPTLPAATQPGLIEIARARTDMPR